MLADLEAALNQAYSSFYKTSHIINQYYHKKYVMKWNKQ